MFSQEEINANPTHYSFTMGAGYKRLGPLVAPSNPVGGAKECEPTFMCEEDSWHRIVPPNQPDGVYIRMRWDPTRKLWHPPLEAQGRRVAYTSQYLAAHGWTYGEAE